MKVWAIAAGKGGVGKSSCCALLAEALARKGYQVAVLDADLHGPSMGVLFPQAEAAVIEQGKIIPALSRGIRCFSLAYCQLPPVFAVRAPVANSVIKKMALQVEWGACDYLLVDFPPGTGDIALSLLQELVFTAAVLVTTPQGLAAMDVEKMGEMFLQMGVPVAGVIENMAYFQPDPLGEKYFPLGIGGGERVAAYLQAPLWGQVPLDSSWSQTLDQGESLWEKNPSSASLSLVEALADCMVEEPTRKELFSVERVDAQQVRFFWDRHTKNRLWRAEAIQRRCPCAACRKGVGGLDPGVSIEKIEQVGNYGVRMQFSSGCSQGIFPFSVFCREE